MREAARLAAEACNRMGTSGACRVQLHLAGELTLRALRRSVERARGESDDADHDDRQRVEVGADVEPRLLLCTSSASTSASRAPTGM